MIINHNISALNNYRQMGINNTANAKSMEKLSSGLRINRAGDDAAGLAISEKMRAQVRGLDQAQRNSQDGISMIQTAEGALQETHNILQRMRELATQAANDTNVDVDRNEIQKEMNQLTSEINRIGNTTEFNTQKILRGEGSDPNAQGALNLDKTGLATQTILQGGKIAPAKEATLQVKIDDAGDEIKNENLEFDFNGQTITVNFAEEDNNNDDGDIVTNAAGNEVTIYLKDSTTKESIARRLEEALGKAIEVNEDINMEDYTISRDGNALTISTKATGKGQELGVTASADDAKFEARNGNGTDAYSAANGAGGVTAAGTNKVGTEATAEVTFTIANITNEALKSGLSADNTPEYFTATPGELSVDGMVKFLEGKGMTIGEETIEFYNSDNGEYSGTADYAVDLNSITFGTGTDAAAVEDLALLVEGIVDQVGSKMKGVNLTDTSADDDSTAKLTMTAREAGIEGNTIELKDGVTRPATDVVGSTFNATFQIGANKGQSMTIEIGDMRAEALNISGSAGGTHTTVEGAKFTSVNNVTNGTDNEETTAALDISTHESATAAIEVINNAIEKVSAQRSNLGAFQNRLEHTISNLGNASENLTAAESRIRDVDMAKEVMEMTRANILSQASQSMLAQANQKPQSVLQLLG